MSPADLEYDRIAKTVPGVIAYSAENRTVVISYENCKTYHDLILRSRVVVFYKSNTLMYIYKDRYGTADAVEKLSKILGINLTTSMPANGLIYLHMDSADSVIMKLKYGHLI